MFCIKFFQNDGIAAALFFLTVKITKNHEKRIVFHGFFLAVFSSAIMELLAGLEPATY